MRRLFYDELFCSFRFCSFCDLLKAAKVAKGCLYGHFENKRRWRLRQSTTCLKKISGRIGGGYQQG